MVVGAVAHYHYMHSLDAFRSRSIVLRMKWKIVNTATATHNSNWLCVSFFPVSVVAGFRRVFAGVGFIVIWWCSSIGGVLRCWCGYLIQTATRSLLFLHFSLFTKESISFGLLRIFASYSSSRCLITLNAILEHWFSLNVQSMSACIDTFEQASTAVLSLVCSKYAHTVERTEIWHQFLLFRTDGFKAHLTSHTTLT